MPDAKEAISTFADASGNAVAVSAANPMPSTATLTGGGDASATNQTSQITQETAIAGGVGTAADAAATQGSTGSISAKLRTATGQLNTQAGLIGALAETAPASDTASSGLNGRLQRIAQNIATNAAAVSALATTTVLAAGTATIGYFIQKDSSGNVLNHTKSSATVGQNTLSTSAELVVAALATRMHAEITNDDAAIKVYWGQTSGVLTTTGHVIKPGATKNFDGFIGDIYCIAASGTPLVTFEEW